MGHLAYGITAFLISKVMFIEHNVTDMKKKKKHKSALPSQESSLLTDQENIYSNSYSIL